MLCGNTCRPVPHNDAALLILDELTYAVKYGWVDWWYGVVLRRDPVPVVLDPR